ncbi:hypothetical protein BRAO375_990053 [Bradyrhizobium sp. ORS 375]|nr:hypothetical protein BRAO375_990053 [Bradyrhizobium sp. ORS 375]
MGHCYVLHDNPNYHIWLPASPCKWIRRQPMAELSGRPHTFARDLKRILDGGEMTVEHAMRPLIDHEVRELTRVLQSKIEQNDGLPEVVPDGWYARSRRLVPPRARHRNGILRASGCGRFTK